MGFRRLGPVALKVSLSRWGWRLEREVYLRSQHPPEGYYAPSPADDLYALGVTAYRLVMGQYPGRMEARGDEQGHWQVPSLELRPLLEDHSQVEPGLRQVLVRLLSEAPEDRGTAGQVAEARSRSSPEKD
ncbi:MAG TPA: hypothetical protein VK539_25515 [Myxococcaceae bacterium]|nr:hypothetical protein [Myxococcaceae bacterium]